MPFRQVVFSILAVILISTPAAAQTPIPRDPDAVALLARSYLAMGGAPIAAIRDSRADVVVTSHDGEKTIEQAVTLKTLGKTAWRSESQRPEGLAVSIVNGDWGISKLAADEEQFPSVSVAEAGNWWFPAFSVISEWADGNLQVEYVEGAQNGTIHHIRVQRRPQSRGLAEILKPCEVFLDAQTFLPIKIQFFLHPPENLLVSFPVEVSYSDYRNISGILIPFHVTYALRGRVVSEYSVKQVLVNTGVSEAEFAVR